MNNEPYSAKHGTQHAAEWIYEKLLDLWPLIVFLFILWLITDGLIYLDLHFDLSGKRHRAYRWVRRIPCRFGLHDWGHFSDGDFCYWCGKRRDK